MIVEPEPRDGAWNMAVDETLLEAALHEQVCTVRWYRWDPPTISLGYFQQAPEQVLSAPPLPVVRRLSGGGAILHDQEWTYSIAVPPSHEFTPCPERLYLAVHEQLIDWLNSRGVMARLRNETFVPSSEPFLCFGRGDPRDIVVGPHKVVGSAQRRRQRAILQHGSLLLRRSRHAPEFPGLLDLGMTNTPTFDEIRELGLTIGNILSQSVCSDTLTGVEQLRIQNLMESRYRQPEWTNRNAISSKQK
ncbi:MAG: biotin/lipoate A/B protein ligase family protein [Planctomycetaceae bacterium]